MRTMIGRMPIFRKKEAERTKKEKIIRDCVFFGLLIFICGMCLKTVYVMADVLEATAKLSEVNYLIAQNVVEGQEKDEDRNKNNDEEFEGIVGEVITYEDEENRTTE